MDQDELVAHIRRHSNAFARGRSRYRGVSGRPGRWEARIGCFLGKKNVSFGVFEAESEAARQVRAWRAGRRGVRPDGLLRQELAARPGWQRPRGSVVEVAVRLRQVVFIGETAICCPICRQ